MADNVVRDCDGRCQREARLYETVRPVDEGSMRAAKFGHLNCMVAAWQHATDANRVLCAAARSGSLACMNAAHDRGGRHVNDALAAAARGGHPACMVLARRWGANLYDAALIAAAGSGHINTMKQARRWGARDYERALRSAAQGGYPAAMKLVRRWIQWAGMSWPRGLMCDVAHGADNARKARCIELADQWGDRNNLVALAFVANGKRILLRAVLRCWSESLGPMITSTERDQIYHVLRTALLPDDRSLRMLLAWLGGQGLRGLNLEPLMRHAVAGGHVACLRLLREADTAAFHPDRLLEKIVCRNSIYPDSLELQPESLRILCDWGASDRMLEIARHEVAAARVAGAPLGRIQTVAWTDAPRALQQQESLVAEFARQARRRQHARMLGAALAFASRNGHRLPLYVLDEVMQWLYPSRTADLVGESAMVPTKRIELLARILTSIERVLL